MSFLGIDLGTQSMKALLIDPAKGTVSETVSVHYGRDLPEYNSPSGFLPHSDPAVRQADPLMFAAALDLLFTRMNQANWPLAEVSGISGSAQQHGTVYLNDSFPERLKNLFGNTDLASGLQAALSRAAAPIWMDASTGKECELLQKHFGKKLRDITGSDAVMRFAAAQIMKFSREEEEKYRRTTFIHLLSSFMTSILAGENMPIDHGDGAGMNLLDLRTMQWHPELTAFTAPGLLEKLPACAPSAAAPGKLSGYFAKYGLRPGIPVNLWSGDNPVSLIGCGGYAPGTAVISLGTSDTFFGSAGSLTDIKGNYGHIFGNPAGGFMTLLCFANGSLAREVIREKFNLSWEETAAAVNRTFPGRHQLLPFVLPESTPPVSTPGMLYDFDCRALSPGEFIRAFLESQMLTIRFHAGNMLNLRSIRLTGGASVSPLLRQLAADVFQVPVYTGGSAETAALGAAMRAANSIGKYSFAGLTEKFCAPETIIVPDRNKAEIYDRALENFTVLYNSRIR
ncbi:MAG: carbohydrate kinase [Lentisphaeria bacterium]|nr:carbohydrate kinase [Lentisphaeria bacterium]